jgi:hypothetical protein
MNTIENNRALNLILSHEEINDIISGSKKTVSISNEVSINQIYRVNLHTEQEETYINARIVDIEHTGDEKILTIKPEIIMF